MLNILAAIISFGVLGFLYVLSLILQIVNW